MLNVTRDIASDVVSTVEKFTRTPTGGFEVPKNTSWELPFENIAEATVSTTEPNTPVADGLDSTNEKLTLLWVGVVEVVVWVDVVVVEVVVWAGVVVVEVVVDLYVDVVVVCVVPAARIGKSSRTPLLGP
jgi:hypothetical protein